MSSNSKELEKFELKGRLCIGNIQNIYAQVLTSIKTSNCLNLYLSEISEIDLAFLQVLYSSFKTAHKKGKEMSVFIDEPEGIRDIIIKAGFENHLSVHADPGGADFQIEGNFR